MTDEFMTGLEFQKDGQCSFHFNLPPSKMVEVHSDPDLMADLQELLFAAVGEFLNPRRDLYEAFSNDTAAASPRG